MRSETWRRLGCFTSQLVINGNVTQAQISRTFRVPLVTVKRYVKLYRQGGVHAYFAPEKRRTGHKLSAEVRQHGQYRERECHEAESKVEVPLRVLYRVSRHPEAPCEANLSSLKEIEKPAGIKNPARLKACRGAILPTG
jgi:hypothetical protein